MLKSEIARVARRQIRAELAAVKRASSSYRRTIAALKRQVSALEKKSSQIEKHAKNARTEESAPPETDNRFQARGFKTLRRRLGLSAEKMGILLGGVSPLSVYAWETGRTKPRKANLAAIASLRSLGKREAEARLQAAAQTSGKAAGAKSGARSKRAAERKRAVRAKRK